MDCSTVFCLCISSARIYQIGHCLTQLEAPNPLEECTSQLPNTKVASQRCHMELFNKNLTRSTTFGDHSLIHSISISVCHKKLWITGPCTKKDLSHCQKHHAVHLLSASGTMALLTRYYMHLGGFMQPHRLPHQEKYY